MSLDAQYLGWIQRLMMERVWVLDIEFYIFEDLLLGPTLSSKLILYLNPSSSSLVWRRENNIFHPRMRCRKYSSLADNVHKLFLTEDILYCFPARIFVVSHPLSPTLCSSSFFNHPSFIKCIICDVQIIFFRGTSMFSCDVSFFTWTRMIVNVIYLFCTKKLYPISNSRSNVDLV